MKEKTDDRMVSQRPAEKKFSATEALGPSLQFQKEENDKQGKKQIGLVLSDGTKLAYESKERFSEAMKKATGTGDFNYSLAILVQVSRGMCDLSEEQRLTRMTSLLPVLRPQDETEALLAGQFLALQQSAMDYLHLAHIQDGFYHVERYTQLSAKLFNVANQTMQTLLKYRAKGQQTVQVIHVHNEGQAIVAQNIASGGEGGGIIS